MTQAEPEFKPALRARSSPEPRAPDTATSQALARRRSALLRRARRHGELRVTLRPGGAAADVSALLDQLNEDGLLRYGGFAHGEILYLPA